MTTQKPNTALSAAPIELPDFKPCPCLAWSDVPDLAISLGLVLALAIQAASLYFDWGLW